MIESIFFMSKYFKKADLILLVIILALSAAGFVFLRHSSDAQSKVEVTIDGQRYGIYALNQDSRQVVSSNYGYNTIIIQDGQVWVEDADCANKDCMRFGKISKEGQIILCLPHKLAVRIVGGEVGIDAISY